MKKLFVLFSLLAGSIATFAGPSLKSISKNSASGGTTLQVSISAVGKPRFLQGSVTAVALYQASRKIYGSNITVVNDSNIKVTFAIPLKVWLGNYDLVVNSQLDGPLTLPQSFVVTGGTQPAVTGVLPLGGSVGKKVNLDISGKYTSFKSGSATLKVSINLGDSVVFSSSDTVKSETRIISVVNIPANFPIGQYTLKVYYSADSTLELKNAFNVGKAAGIENRAFVASVQVFPNPSASDVFIKIDQANPEEIQLDVLNVLGQKVYSEKTGSTADLMLRLNAGIFENSGLYLIRISNKEGERTEKVLIRKD